MARKKGQQKESEKHGVNKDEKVEFSERNLEYIRVGEFENKKYDKRVIESNWSKYEAEPEVKFQTGDEDNFSSTTDFSFLMKNASSDCSHFQFNSEKLWNKKENVMPSSEIFNLDLNVLSAGLACLPLYDRIALDKSELSIDEIAIFDEEAQKNGKAYIPIMENFLMKHMKRKTSKKRNLCTRTDKVAPPNLASFSSFNTQTAHKPQLKTITSHHNSQIPIKTCLKSSVDDPLPTARNPTATLFGDSKNLEDWLDGVLDD